MLQYSLLTSIINDVFCEIRGLRPVCNLTDILTKFLPRISTQMGVFEVFLALGLWSVIAHPVNLHQF